MDGNRDLETSPFCDLSLNEDHSLEDDDNIIDIDITHNHFDTENHLPLVLGTQYKGNISFAILILIWYLSVSIKMNMTNYDDNSIKLILTSSFGTLSSTYAISCDHHKILFNLANMSDANILKADILLPTSAPHKHLDLRYSNGLLQKEHREKVNFF